MKKIIKELKLKDWLILGIISLIPIIVILNLYKGLDGDIWYLLAEGRYIIKNGIYHIDPLSLHEGLNVVVQNWLSAVIFWIIYAFLGLHGLYFSIIIINIVICILLYSITMLISNKNKLVSTIITLLADISLTMYFTVSKPQIFSFVIILVLIFLLEKYIKEDDPKYLKFIPLLSFLEINMHAAFWWYIILFMIPYLIDSIKCKKLRLQGYRTKPLLITFIISLLIGFINPYGYKALLFIFKSFGNSYMHTYILELKPFEFRNLISIQVLAICYLVIGLTVYFREGEIRIRYLCLFIGTLLIGMMAVKGMSYFMLIAFLPLALLLKDVRFKERQDSKLIYIILGIVLGLSLIADGYFLNKFMKNNELHYQAEDALNTIEKMAGNYPATIYTALNDGGYVEFRGYKAYIDPRAEVFIKKNNGKEDIFKEYYNFQNGSITNKELFDKYKFDFLLINASDRLFYQDDIEGYMIIYRNIDYLYKIYIRSDLVSDEMKKVIEEEYKHLNSKN